MPNRHRRLPDIWLVTDARNDAVLETALKRLPRGSGLVFRHYHLAPGERKRRFERLLRLARRRRHLVVLSGPARSARRWRATGAYGASAALSRGAALLRLVTAHSLREIGMAGRARADAIVLSPVFATRSHPDGGTLGVVRFRLLAARAGAPVIALGGMDARRARRASLHKWAAIDGICGKATRWIHLDS